MKRLAILLSIMISIAVAAGAQAMMAAPPKADASGMMAAPETSGMSYETLKMEGKLADAKMGSQLRMAKSSGMKVAFKNLKTAEGLAMKNPTILFFAADWCPSCQADLKDINANGARLGKANIVVVDYDKSADLKAMYGITVQDTFVQIDAKGAKLAIWNGGGVDGILAHLVEKM